MLPAHLAENIKKQVMFYLQSTFDFSDAQVEAAFERFLVDPENGLFKGPWVQLRRPFRTADEGEVIPFDFAIPFRPFKHQSRSWRRLSSKNQKPQPTIVTTGTGSGKTECFLFPILDHCLRARQSGQKGIKAIILYPMNALASDQERRFAKLIFKTPELKKAGIKVGNYTGRYDPANPGADTGTKAMGENHGISSHATQQENPPDILLTNYKMLDYLLMRPQDQQLWRFNDQGVLQYLVLDELHTYDGAQGSDVACLIRRLKERLSIAKGEFCVVGTSATLDDRGSQGDPSGRSKTPALDAVETSGDRLAKFARTLFEEAVNYEAVIEEDRLTVAEIVHPDTIDTGLPDPVGCHPLDDEDAVGYAIRQAQLWNAPAFGPDHPPAYLMSKEERALTEPERKILNRIEEWSVEVGSWIKRTELFKYLLEVFEENEKGANEPVTWRTLVERVVSRDLEFGGHSAADQSIICASFFALVAQSKELRSGIAFPLVPTQIQLWIRELRRLGRRVSTEPRFNWLDEPEKGAKSLPVFHCSECGESGWVAIADPNERARVQAKIGGDGDQLLNEPSLVYQGWFGFKGMRSPQIVVLSPVNNHFANPPKTDADTQAEFGFKDWYLCPGSLVLRTGDGPCPLTDDPERFPVKVNRVVRDDKTHGAIGNQGCPNCGSTEGVFFIGSQGATLSSVAIDELFGSVLNNDPKLLAFTDSVQDASHRAGFFTARTYHFTFRTALQHVIDDSESGSIPLIEVGSKLLDYWSQAHAGWAGGIKQAISSLLPPDLQQFDDYLEYRNDESAIKPKQRLRDSIEQRLNWEAISEFGLMQMHGRTMEVSGSACVGWKLDTIGKTIDRLVARFPEIDPALEEVNANQIKIWIYGVLHRTRMFGGLSHPYLNEFAKQGFWGKYPFGKVLTGRETHPPMGRFRPRLLVTKSQKDHDFILSPTKRGSRTTWHLDWARKAIGLPNVDETSLLDLIHGLLKVGVETGLFLKLHQDGDKEFFALDSTAAYLTSHLAVVRCGNEGKPLIRPRDEAELWVGAPSIEYQSAKSTYQPAEFNLRQIYYRNRYRKGAVRRVVASEHTGLLSTESREDLEKSFADQKFSDDPNVLTCTSTLEMGIDIGDLSSTMLCSIPPNTASYLQRIGRAGRSTGTALIVSVVNQRPHDLFFYGRPSEMLRGKVDPPGCWLDASAVLVRQYLAYCFDTASNNGILAAFPKSGKELIKDLDNKNGNIPKTMDWVIKQEDVLRSQFLKRFALDIFDDTRQRFQLETDSELLVQKMHVATNEFARMQRELENAQTRLKKQLASLTEDEGDARIEMERELRILKGRLRGLSRTTALEILTDNGLLPNYAFPERGIRFYGAIYNKHQRKQETKFAPIEASRPAASAIKELAPSNHFYTHRRRFEIQQIAIGNDQQPLVEAWAICGACGHMRTTDELNRPDASPACPQCGHDLDRLGQRDLGQHRQFIEFSRSQAISYMEHYESMSGDKSDERNREYYQTIESFDLTRDKVVGAVGDEERPFGIEYRASIILREVNVGYSGDLGVVAFGVDKFAPEEGFQVCKDCGIVATPSKSIGEVRHRSSCKGRRASEKRKQEGRQGDKYNSESVYLYRQLGSEAIRLLLPVSDEDDVETLKACILLGLRLRFEGNPAHLLITPQVMPDHGTGMNRFYLVLMDAVPGGTGFLKSLYQEKNEAGLDGQGLISVLKLAKDALESCVCRKLSAQVDSSDTDGCYRCIRTYHLQYSSEKISRERGIKLLSDLIASGEKRKVQVSLESIKPDQVFGSMLERRFVDRLREFVDAKFGKWESTIIRGKAGFRFSFPESEHYWELELQPSLGHPQGVMVQCRPDFLLHRDDDVLKPIAIFTDGFEFHCYPPNNRLADDFEKRRAILESGNFLVWSIAWDDLATQSDLENLVVLDPLLHPIAQFARAQRAAGIKIPQETKTVGNGFQQLLSLLDTPDAMGWATLATFVVFNPLQGLASYRTVGKSDLEAAIDNWKSGNPFDELPALADGGNWVYNNVVTRNKDLVSYVDAGDAVSNRQKKAMCVARLPDGDDLTFGIESFKPRWRQFLASMNLFQFCNKFVFWATSEIEHGTAPDIPWSVGKESLDDAWQSVANDAIKSAEPIIHELSLANLPLPAAIPQIEFEDPTHKEESFAELAWPNCRPKIAILAGEQASFSVQWEKTGWTVFFLEGFSDVELARLLGLLQSGLEGN